MEIIKEIKEILELRDPDEKDSRLSVLNSEFEYDDRLNKADVIEGTHLLLAVALQEDNKVLRKKFFRTIDQAVVYQDIGDCIDWDALALSLPSLEKRDLVYVLDIIGLSGKRKYFSLLEQYTHHVDPEIRQWAGESLIDLEDTIARASSARKAS